MAEESTSSSSNAPAPAAPVESSGIIAEHGDHVLVHRSEKDGYAWVPRPPKPEVKPDPAAAKPKPDDAPKGEEPEEELEFKPEEEDEDERDTVSMEDGYELAMSDEVPEEVRERVGENIAEAGVIAKSLGIHQDIAQDFVDCATALATLDESRFDPTASNAGEIGMNTLLQRYGKKDTEMIVADARAAVNALGPKAAEYLDRTGLGNSPAVLLALSHFLRGAFRASTETLQRELNAITKGKEGEDLRSTAYHNANHPRHKLARDEAAIIYQLLDRRSRAAGAAPAKTDPRAAAIAPNAPKAPPSSQEAQLKSLIAHPAYRDKSHKEHATIKARVEALYDTVYPGEE
jgi:hypothetical protein